MKNFDFQIDNKLYKIELFAQLLMDSNPQYIFWKDINGVYLGCNKLYAYFCNIASPEAIIGTTDYDYMKADEAKICLAADAEILEKGDAMLNFEEYVTNAHGDARWYNINKIPLRNIDNEVIGILGTMEDVTEKKERVKIIEDTSNRLKIKIRELEDKNKELEQFAFATAHDLQEPLRNILNYGGMLQRQKETEKSELIVNEIVKNSTRMSELIKALMGHFVLGVKSNFQVLDMNEVFQLATENIQGQIDEIQPTIQCAKLPEIKGYKNEMITLVQNLLSNAIKYKKPNVPSVIEVITEQNESENIIHFKDNGIGFDNKYNEKIFELFKKLHHEKDYSGVGIGLTSCKKIIDLHGGKIWATARPDEGAIFSFSIPLNTIEE